MKTYNTVTEVIADLRQRGYTIDLNLTLAGRRNSGSPASLPEDRFEITEVHRFEGETNPDDEAVVYAIESHNGIKGFLLNGYGVSTEPLIDQFIARLSVRH